MQHPVAESDVTILTPRELRKEIIRIVESSCEAHGVGSEQPLTFKLAWQINLEINRLLANQGELLRDGF